MPICSTTCASCLIICKQKNKIEISKQNFKYMYLAAGLGSIPELELELELQAMELELQNGIDWTWNGIEDSISIPPSILLTFPYFLLLMAHIDVLKIADVFFKERICFEISYCKKISVIEL